MIRNLPGYTSIEMIILSHMYQGGKTGNHECDIIQRDIDQTLAAGFISLEPLTCLRIPAMYKAKNSKICNFWTFTALFTTRDHC